VSREQAGVADKGWLGVMSSSSRGESGSGDVTSFL
jgi:hypothetical protein